MTANAIAIPAKASPILLMLTMLIAAIYANIFNAELCCDVCCVAINMD